jgi:hypothetical protein
VQIGLDALLREKPVLHLASRQSVEHVSTRYDALFDNLAERVGLADRGHERDVIARRRLIWSSVERAFTGRALAEAVSAFQAHLHRAPSTILVDGFDWEEAGAAVTVAAAKATAARVGAEIWMTARDTRPVGRAAGIAVLPRDCAALVDVVLYLEPHGRHARVTLVKEFERSPETELALVLEGGMLRVPEADEAPDVTRGEAPGDLSPESFTLLATGSAGAEEEFGACAERWRVREVNFTFSGRRALARTRGLVELSEDELQVGAVSPAYVKVHMHRALSESPELRRVLQAIWHQVSAAGEVFSVGTVDAYKTAHGGTGWAVELARHWGKPVHVFDQARNGWVRWQERDWAEESPPVIAHQRFAGAGTRNLSDDGRAAIRALFERSFGPPAS